MTAEKDRSPTLSTSTPPAPQRANNEVKAGKSTARHVDVEPPAEVETADARSLSSTLLATTVPVKHVEESRNTLSQQETDLRSLQTFHQDVSSTVWYGVASIGGALFTCIFAPLIVDFIKQRMAGGRRQTDVSGLTDQPGQCPKA
jgi:hypothetical protein